MIAQTLSSDKARLQWRNILDDAGAGRNDTVVERYGRPIAAVIPYEDYVALQEALEDLRDARSAAAEYAEWQRDPSTGTDWETVKAELRDEGLLDE